MGERIAVLFGGGDHRSELLRYFLKGEVDILRPQGVEPRFFFSGQGCADLEFGPQTGEPGQIGRGRGRGLAGDLAQGTRFAQGETLPQHILDLFGVGQRLPTGVRLYDLAFAAADNGQRSELLHRRPDGTVIHQVGEHTALFRLDELPQRPGRHSHRFARALGDDGALVEHFALDAADARFAQELVRFEQVECRQVDAAYVLE